MVRDPVCGMKIEEGSAAATSSFGGETYFFCALGCKAAFDREPLRYSTDRRGNHSSIVSEPRNQDTSNNHKERR